jgi:3-hydroxybutyryl-CoA dehydrogenase
MTATPSTLFSLTQAPADLPVLVVGAGIMGAGIAQVAAQAGHPVKLFDVRDGAAAQARDQLAATFDTLVAKQKITAEAAAQTLARIQVVTTLDSAARAHLVVEAIVEKLEAKRNLFQQLEAVVSADCVLATNTSSISVTAIANGLHHPQRLVGMHFFNPVPLMKLVEVVSGLQTAPAVADGIAELSKAWGKTPVHARSTPGFIVNRIARPYYAETLALLQEQAASPAVLDACLRSVGFRMGPCELMDLIGHDTNFSVTRSVYEANFFDKRFVPSLVQAELVDGGLLGRKTGRGFYGYAPGAEKPGTVPDAPALTGLPPSTTLAVAGTGPVADALHQRLAAQVPGLVRLPDAGWVGLQVDAAQLRLTDGRTATELGGASAIDTAVFDWPTLAGATEVLAWAPSARASDAWQAQVPLWLQALGFNPQRLADASGLVVARTLSMLVNEAADAVQQGVCSPAGADAAMKLGVNYPAGPFDWLARWGPPAVVQVLAALDATYRGERYRTSPWLQQRAALV